MEQALTYDYKLGKRIPDLHTGFYGVMVSTLDSESSDPSSNLGRTYDSFSTPEHAKFTLTILDDEKQEKVLVIRRLDWHSFVM